MTKRRKTRVPKRLAVLLSLLIALCLSLITGAIHLLRENNLAAALTGAGGTPTSSAAAPEGTLSVHLMDVGQGDGILILGPDKTVLIDCGESEYGPAVEVYLQDQGVESLDLAIATHPHSDHMGAMARVVERFPIGTFLMPAVPEDMTPTSGVYRSLLTALSDAELKITKPRSGARYDLGDGAVLTILGPLEDYGDLNDYSVVCRVDYGETSFLFTGDAEKPVESDLLASGTDLGADVLKAGHHGSSTSTSAKFLQAVDPEIVLLSCGIDNRYGHPSPETLEALGAQGADIYRTDLCGSVVVTSDGTALAVSTEIR